MNNCKRWRSNEGLRLQEAACGGKRGGREQLIVSVSPVGKPATGHDLLELLDLTATIAELTQAVEQEAEKCPRRSVADASRVGPLTALAFVLIIGRADRFQCGKKIPAIWDWRR